MTQSNALNFCHTKYNFGKPNPDLVYQIQINQAQEGWNFSEYPVNALFQAQK